MKSVYYRKGNQPDNTTVIVLSAAGRFEEQIKRPAAGKTGDNLDQALKLLHLKNQQMFPYCDLDDYTITNAIDAVYYASKTNTSEATIVDILKESNLNRLLNDIKDYATVLALGNKAILAVESCGYNGTILKGSHPSFRSINSIKSDKSTAQERNQDRICKWVNSII